MAGKFLFTILVVFGPGFLPLRLSMLLIIGFLLLSNTLPILLVIPTFSFVSVGVSCLHFYSRPS